MNGIMERSPLYLSFIVTISPQKPHTYELRESNVRLRLTVVDTVGYGDQINKEDCWKPIVDYIDAQFEGEL